LHVLVEGVGDGRGHVFHGYDPVLAVGCLLQDDPGWITSTLGQLMATEGFEVGRFVEVKLVQDVQ
jgi:hypothetical protein